ncbi:MAG: DUF932 domain-containing protein [Roseibacillus sp.]
MNILPLPTGEPTPFSIVAPVPEQPVKGMLLHCGADLVDRNTLYGVKTPRGTDTWFPLSHRALLEEVQSRLEGCGFSIGRESHALSHEGARYFGVMEVKQFGQDERDYAWVVGLRNSHDKTFPAGVVAGTSVFTCDNLAFCGEVKISRKHTRHAYRDLRELTAGAIGQLGDRFEKLDKRIDSYKNALVADWAAHDMVVRAVDCNAITPSQLPEVLKEWREPSHGEFRPRNLWSLFNAFTEAYKKQNPATTMRRSEALHGLCDGFVGIAN